MIFQCQPGKLTPSWAVFFLFCGAYTLAWRLRGRLRRATVCAHLFQLFGLSQGSLQMYRWIPRHISNLHWLREMPTQKNIYENQVGSAEWLRMPTRCCKYLKFAYADSVGVPFLTNSFHGKKNVAQLRSFNLYPRYLGITHPFHYPPCNRRDLCGHFPQRNELPRRDILGEELWLQSSYPTRGLYETLSGANCIYLDGIQSKMTQAYEENTLVLWYPFSCWWKSWRS